MLRYPAGRAPGVMLEIFLRLETTHRCMHVVYTLGVRYVYVEGAYEHRN